MKRQIHEYLKACCVCRKLHSSISGRNFSSKEKFYKKNTCSQKCFIYYLNIISTRIVFTKTGEKTTFMVGDKECIIDTDTISTVKDYKLYIGSHGYVTGYKIGVGEGSEIKDLLHHLIIGKHTPMAIDHVNGNKLDNRRINLRVVTQHQNTSNSKNRKIGLRWAHKRKNGNYTCSYNHNGKSVYLGDFKTEVEAHNKVVEYIRINGLKLPYSLNKKNSTARTVES